jgi:transcriptional regulator with XRE-family HTH domain
MAVKRQSYSQFEAAEANASISIASVQRAAEAMDCELVYFIVPRGAAARSYADLALSNDPATRHLKATEHSMDLRNGGDTG